MADVSELQVKLHKRAKVLHQLSTDKILRELDRVVPKGKTLQLQNSVQSRETAGPSLFKTTITYPTDIANYTNDGTKPYVIYPRYKKALKFEIKGKTIFAKYVFHPGIKARRWFTKSTNQQAWSRAVRSTQQIRNAINRSLG